jgi:signal peptidase I
MILLKPVFIIAIVAVAMIGVMVPSVFAFEYWSMDEIEQVVLDCKRNIDPQKNVKVQIDQCNYDKSVLISGHIHKTLFRIPSASMVPTIDPSDIIIIKKIPFEQVQVGDIIVFDKPSDHNKQIIHRVVSILNEDPKTIRTQGDANPESIEGTDYPITEEEYIGKLIEIRTLDEVCSKSSERMCLEIEKQHAKSMKELEGGGCLIATATYGSELAPQVQQLRELRDNQLLNTESGTQFMGMFNDVYYSFSPVIADYERENPYFKEVVKIAITPMISSLSLMENAESESEVLSIGLSVIALNLGMYLGVPAVVIVGIRKRF